MSIKDLRTRSKMSRQQFADFFSIPYRTLQNWELGTRDCPEYLLELIEYKLRNEGFFYEKETVLIPQNINPDLIIEKTKEELAKQSKRRKITTSEI